MRGETLDGRYRLTEPIGSGGMGQVWRAEDERIGREVAVKVLSRIDEDTSASRFAREARVVGRLSSPHIVTLHDFGEAQVAGERVLYLVMEHLKGRDLGAVLESRRPELPSPAEVVGWAVEICAGLETAHSAGIVHRDIKPANVLLTDSGTVKILDFGIARLLSVTSSAAADLTGTGFMIGTPLYMSPEQIRAPDVLDSRSDLYSLGCLLHTLLTGRPPFTGAGTTVLARHLGDVPEPLSTHRPGVAGLAELEPLIGGLLAKDPDDRPEHAADVARLLLESGVGDSGSGSGRRSAAGANPGVGAAAPSPDVSPDASSGSVPEPPAPVPPPTRTPTAVSTPAPSAPDPSAVTVTGSLPYARIPQAPTAPVAAVTPPPATAPSPPTTPPPSAPTTPPAAPFPPPFATAPTPASAPVRRQRLRITQRATRNGGTASTRSVAATWLAGAGTGLLTGVLVFALTPLGLGAVALIAVGSCLAGMGSAQVFADIFNPVGQPFGKRLSSTVALMFPLGIGGTAIQQAAEGHTSLVFLPLSLCASAAAMTLGVLLADGLMALFRIPARAALLLSMSGWTNGLVVWALLTYRTPLHGMGALPIACAVWGLTALALGRLLSRADRGSRPAPPA
ncbi:serine/threonine-protein kinase [Streptomyces sp. NPDC052164]|uniref:serine/threonine-protein kinase n=1 Tax=Streptomyces sp. NPDC052164 TaxID=3155529 RepID=UPI003434E68F